MKRRTLLIAATLSPLAACSYPLELGLTNLTGRDVAVANARDTILRAGRRTVILYPWRSVLALRADDCIYTYMLDDHIGAFPRRIRVTDPPELSIGADMSLYLVAEPARIVPGTGNPAAFPVAPLGPGCA